MVWGRIGRSPRTSVVKVTVIGLDLTVTSVTLGTSLRFTLRRQQGEWQTTFVLPSWSPIDGPPTGSEVRITCVVEEEPTDGQRSLGPFWVETVRQTRQDVVV